MRYLFIVAFFISSSVFALGYNPPAPQPKVFGSDASSVGKKLSAPAKRPKSLISLTPAQPKKLSKRVKTRK
jgi:hypothetical protein